MKIEFLKYAKSVRSESGDERLEASARLEKNESPDMAFEDLKKFVREKLGLKSGQQEFKNNPFSKLSENDKIIEGGKATIKIDGKVFCELSNCKITPKLIHMTKTKGSFIALCGENKNNLKGDYEITENVESVTCYGCLEILVLAACEDTRRFIPIEMKESKELKPHSPIDPAKRNSRNKYG